MKLEIKKIGNSTGLILPKELLTKFDLQRGSGCT
jgi:antitoxin component of MazEF toxin-antitoxin module